MSAIWFALAVPNFFLASASGSLAWLNLTTAILCVVAGLIETTSDDDTDE